MKKVLTTTEYYQALGLFMLAQNAYRESEKYYTALANSIGEDESGHISDEVYCDGSLDIALKRLKITVEDVSAPQVTLKENEQKDA